MASKYEIKTLNLHRKDKNRFPFIFCTCFLVLIESIFLALQSTIWLPHLYVSEPICHGKNDPQNRKQLQTLAWLAGLIIEIAWFWLWSFYLGFTKLFTKKVKSFNNQVWHFPLCKLSVFCSSSKENMPNFCHVPISKAIMYIGIYKVQIS